MKARIAWCAAATISGVLVPTAGVATAAPTPSQTSTAATAPGSPLVDSVAPVWTDHGTVVRVAAHGSAGVSTLHVVAYPMFSGAPGIPLGPFTLVSGSAQSGVWETTSPLGLPRDVYDLGADVVDGNGVDSPVAGSPENLDYAPAPAAHITSITPALLDYSAQQVTVTGRFTTYDPSSGYLAGPYTAPARAVLTSPNGTRAAAQSNPADGSFSVTLAPGPGYAGQSLALHAVYAVGNADAQETPSTVVPMQAQTGGTPTRITLDSPGADQLVRASSEPVSGRIDYFGHDGLWHPLPHTWVGLDTGSGDARHGGNAADSDADGRFTVWGAVPDAPATWTVRPAAAPDADLLLAPSSATFRISSVAQRIDLALTEASVTWESKLWAWDTHSSTNGHYPAGRIYLQESPDGSHGWKTVGTIPTTSNGTRTIIVPVDNPHGWYRTYSPASPGYGATYSNAVHTSRYEDLVTGGRPTTTVVRRGGWLTVSGALWRRGSSGGWTRCPAHVPVLLTSRAAGFSDWSLNALVHTDGHGNFSFRVRDYGNLFWQVEAQDYLGVLTFGPQTYVRLR